MAIIWTKKEEGKKEIETLELWDEMVSHRNIHFPRSLKSLLELSKLRHSVRGYKNIAVKQEDLEYIMECARLAPSAVNRQPWHFYVCTSAESLQKVQQCYDREWFKTAPMVIVGCICHDEEWIRPHDSHPHGIVDISIATEHICLAAAERGLGSCWVCNFDATHCHELLNLPENQEAAVLIPLGVPASDEIPEKKRKDAGEIITEI